MRHSTSLKERCPTNITIGNDAKCAANAEIGYGNLQDILDGAVVILGTGIGGCLIKNHQVHTGCHFSAGEFSFVKTDYQDFMVGIMHGLHVQAFEDY
ncbi:ROK family protein [Faecalibacillus intestinalis]|uniref:ROK family protein n=1 Tax=Faecalibacillus intestinalis TaxID=1982626 RepID=UPI002989B37B|nr:ROK family protein [Faecalibacillus intestinalis]